MLRLKAIYIHAHNMILEKNVCNYYFTPVFYPSRNLSKLRMHYMIRQHAYLNHQHHSNFKTRFEYNFPITTKQSFLWGMGFESLLVCEIPFTSQPRLIYAPFGSQCETMLRDRVAYSCT